MRRLPSRSRAPGRVAAAAAVLCLLAASAGCGGGGSGSAADAGATVPMKVLSHGKATLEIVPVTIGGHGPYDFILDTGSAVSSVDRRLVTKLHLKQTGTTKQVRGVASTTKVPLVQIRSWKVGKVSLAPERLTAIDLSKTAGGPLDGLLGSDQLKRFGTASVDFQHHELRLAHVPQGSPAPSG